MTQLDATSAVAPMGDRSVQDCQRTYERIAPVYDLLDGFYEWSWKRRLRADLFTRATGKVLDVGVGTGCNMAFYPAGSTVTGIDNSQAMLTKARARARSQGRQVALYEMNLLDLKFQAHSFDTVAVTFVLLCLPDDLQGPALKELARVVRPGGRILILDYRLSQRRSLRLWMQVLSPWLKWAFAARFNPQTERFIDEAGLTVVERRTFMSDGALMLVLEPKASATA